MEGGGGGGGGHKPCSTKLRSYSVKNNMETYYPCTSISSLNQKNEENKELKFVNENYISIAHKPLFFKRTDLYTVSLFFENTDN